jgi:sporulation protein YlmC with PRC-barrel domain
MLLVRQIMDKEIVDRNGFKAGKVDDLVLDLRSGEAPVVAALVTGPGSLPPILGRKADQALRWGRRLLLGALHDPQPQLIEWKHVDHIDVAVHLDIEREEADMMRTEDAVWNRWIRWLPFAER